MRSVLFGLLALGMASTAQAASIRYSFDVIDSTIGFQSLEAVSPNAPEPFDTAAVIAGLHPLRNARGRTGRVVLDFADHPIAAYRDIGYRRLTCVSGVLCDLEEGRLLNGNAPAESNAWVATPQAASPSAEDRWDNAIPSGYFATFAVDLAAGTGSLSVIDDARISEIATYEGVEYLWWAPEAHFALADVRRSEGPGQTAVVPAPLPASTLLLAIAILPLVARGRRAGSRAETLPRIAKRLSDSAT